ncbi:MAG: hypothetical protein P8X77_13700 [Maritimibacter sp.]
MTGALVIDGNGFEVKPFAGAVALAIFEIIRPTMEEAARPGRQAANKCAVRTG